MKIVVEEKALHEIKEASAWYLEKSVVAAENFQKEITLTIDSLHSGLIEHRKIFSDISLIQLKIFPYNIYFTRNEVESIIRIIAVLHNKRDSRFIAYRLLG